MPVTPVLGRGWGPERGRQMLEDSLARQTRPNGELVSFWFNDRPCVQKLKKKRKDRK